MRAITDPDFDPRGRRLLIGVDFNVHLAKAGTIPDDSRVRATRPTVRSLLDRQPSRLLLMSHLGRPKGPDPALSLAPVARRLQQLLGQPVLLLPGCVGPAVEAAAAELRGQVGLLENLRFHKEEEANDPEFALRLAALGDLFVNDAFGAAHRAHASTEGITHFLPSYAGLLLQK